jgi:Cupredoxin-like domain
MSKNHKTTKSTKAVKTVEAAKAPEIAKTATAKTAGASPMARWALVLTLAVLAFSATYGYAIARGSAAPAAATYAAATAPVTPLGTAPVAGSTTPKSGGASCACCGGAKAPAGAQTSKPADVTGNVQKITVDTSKGYYDPSTIELKAGIPAEITFTQATGCLQYVESADLGFSEDLSGGPKTVKLGPLAAGTYGFNCGMQMQFGSIVVK